MEPNTWQALSAMCLVERSGFGLNALLDLRASVQVDATTKAEVWFVESAQRLAKLGTTFGAFDEVQHVQDGAHKANKWKQH